jgi:peroxiredoxin
MKHLILTTILFLPFSGFAQTGTAPDFVLPDLAGENCRLSKNFGQGPILINFWATWCAPCLEEMKKLKEVHQTFAKAGLTILSISIDDPKTVGKVKSFVNTNRYPFKFLLDTNNEVFKRYQGVNVPFTVLLDRQGQVVYTHTGYRKGDEKKLQEQIAKLISQD